MRVVVVWRRESEYGQELESWIRDLGAIKGKEVESMDPDEMKNQGFLQAYDVVEYPTILGLDDSGKVLESWRGMPLPRLDEVSYYANSREN